MGSEGKRQAVISAAVVIAIIGVVAALALAKPHSDDSQAMTPRGQQTAQMTPSGTAAPAGSYKDGTYSATGSYHTPGGIERIKVAVTLASGVVKDSSVQSLADNRTSSEHQGAFIEQYKNLVVGKPIDEVSITRVSGSSLTPKGFDAAIEQIKSQAKA